MLTSRSRSYETDRSGEQGWALLGLMLALSVMAIVLASAVVPNVKVQVQRDKELEMMYRGEQMARGIARYYGRGNLIPLQLMVPPEYGYLTDMKKLREGITIGVREIKFVRTSATIDPMTSSDWEPVRARDPRIMKVLQAYAAETNSFIPQQYLLIAGPPQKLHVVKSPTSPTSPGNPANTAPGAAPTSPEGAPTTPPGAPPQSTAPGVQPRPGSTPDEDDDDDDDDEANDPLAHLFGQGSSGPGINNTPIVGVAPKLKGQSIRALYGLDHYEDWVFIYIPDQTQLRQPPGVNPGVRGNNNRPQLQISQ
jgi:hypothetical protein